ncbi:hypothetical protein [Plantactinospora sonchi]|uniref:Uncharacterized protein n=1 Tax=Plantactinospora sonchi TaxID=1544735 RepID=A0ABU7RNX9_9ACTN
MTAPAGGFLHMDSGAVLPVLQALDECGRTVGEAWRSSRDTITGAEPGIGGDTLGQAFRSVYTAPGTELRTAADRLPGLIVADAAVGAQCVADYRTADARGAAAITAVPGAVAGGGPGGGARADF